VSFSTPSILITGTCWLIAPGHKTGTLKRFYLSRSANTSRKTRESRRCDTIGTIGISFPNRKTFPGIAKHRSAVPFPSDSPLYRGVWMAGQGKPAMNRRWNGALAPPLSPWPEGPTPSRRVPITWAGRCRGCGIRSRPNSLGKTCPTKQPNGKIDGFRRFWMRKKEHVGNAASMICPPRFLP